MRKMSKITGLEAPNQVPPKVTAMYRGRQHTFAGGQGYLGNERVHDHRAGGHWQGNCL